MIQAVIFDLDGTLANTALLHKKAWEIALKEMGEQPSFDITILLGRKTLDIAKILVGDEKAEALASVKTNIYNSLVEQEAKPTECAQEIVESFKDAGIRVSVVTSSKRVSAEKVLEIIQISPHLLVTNDDVEKGKPHPEPVLKALKSLGADPRLSIGVGDTSYDIMAYNAAGLSTSYFLRGEVPVDPSSLNGLKFTEITSLCQLLHVLKGI